MKLWRVDNWAASWGDNDGMIIVAETAERALELFDIEDLMCPNGTMLERRTPTNITIVEVVWPREEEGVLLISNIGS